MSKRASSLDCYLKQCEFLRYDNRNQENKKLRDDLLHNNLAIEISRNMIREDYVEDTVTNEDIIGFIAKINGVYAGYVLYKHIFDTFYLSLIATKPKLGIPLGQILMQKLETEARKNKILKLQADAGKNAVEFYTMLGWNVVYFNEQSNEFAIEKNMCNQNAK
eukprot:407652_1